jgi:sirohydrochlorin ferrochelatase
MKGRIAVLAIMFGVWVTAAAAASEGILLLAHNGTPEWTARVKELAAKVDSQKPVEVVFGISGRSSIAVAVGRLASRGVTQVVAVPFFYPAISPEDLAGHAVPVRTGAAFAADPVFADVVRSRADEISAGGSEMLVVVGYGSEDGGKPWKLDLDPVARRLNGGRFASVLTIGRPAEQTAAEQRQVRAAVERQVAAGRSILVVPILAADGERDPALEPMLQGFSYRIAKGAVITDDRVVDWLLKQATPSPR